MKGPTAGRELSGVQAHEHQLEVVAAQQWLGLGGGKGQHRELEDT